MSIKGDIVKRFITRGKHVIVFNIIGKGYGFRISDLCNKKDYYNADMYETQCLCEREAMKVCKSI